MAAGAKIAAIVLGFDRRDKTRACVASLLRSTEEGIRVLVLDNGSRDGTAESIAREFPEVLVERSPVNLGAAAGRNHAVALAVREWSPKLLWFVDDDAVVDPASASALASPFAAPESATLGATAAKIRFPGEPPRIYVAGGSVIRFWAGSTEPRGHGDPDKGQFDVREPCIPGAGCTMIRREAFDAVGGFDEDYDPYGYEDLDLSLRILETGREILYVPEALAWHERGQTFERGRYTARYASVKRRNWLRFMGRHASPLQRVAFWTVGAPWRIVRATVREVRAGNLSAVGGLLGLGGRDR